MPKSIVSLWFPRLASDRVLRARPTDRPFALTVRDSNADQLYCLNPVAEQMGMVRGMGLSDARALCPEISTQPFDLQAHKRFQYMLARWATRYCPWVGLEGSDGLVMDVSGASHLFGGESPMLEDMQQRLTRSGLHVQAGQGQTRGAAWALARFGGRGVFEDLPIAALRLSEQTCTDLQRLGLRVISDLTALPRSTLARRFGTEVLLRLDQALGQQPEAISPLPEPKHFGVRMTLPDPIGLTSDVMAGLERLLSQLCTKLKAQEQGARVLQLTLRRVDQASQQVELRLARPMRDVNHILPLFARGVDEIDAGYGIDHLRLEAVQVEPLPAEQLGSVQAQTTDGLHDLITRLGSRIGLDNIIRFLPADSHIPEQGFIIAPAAYSEPETGWSVHQPRPIRLFPPEYIEAQGHVPPKHFRWRRMVFSTGRMTGPERIAPEWWLAHEAWSTGVRDYWRVDTLQGRRLWLFHTPQNPGWFVQGEFA